MIDEEYISGVFEHLHGIPEAGFEEHQTSAFLKEEVTRAGYRITGEAGTGFAAVLDSGHDGPAMGLRTDMDALRFSIDGKDVNIHACGHDANMTMTLAAARAVAGKGIKKGRLFLVCQPAEEVLGGALSMIESGLIDEVEEMIGIHLRPIQEAKLGQATPALCHGASTKLDVTVKGEASHGARPHLGVNAIEAAMLAINAINSVKLDPRVPHSVKVTRISGGGKAHNIIPDRASFTADVRAQTNEVKDELFRKVKMAVEGGVGALGAECDVAFDKGCPAAKYDDRMVGLVKGAIEEVLGSAMDPIVTPGGEDFHFYATEKGIKTAYVGLGADLVPGLHSPEMTFDRKALPIGAKILATAVLKELG